MNSELFYLNCLFSDRGGGALAPAVVTVISILLLAFPFFFTIVTNSRVFMWSVCLSAAVIVAGVQMVPHLARCTFHILIWLQ